jgi:hypothetical protein
VEKPLLYYKRNPNLVPPNPFAELSIKEISLSPNLEDTTTEEIFPLK